MRAVIYAKTGDASVLQVAERPREEPAEGEVRIRVVVSGVNPTDWKSRSGSSGGTVAEATVPNQDGAGVVDEVGPGVDGLSAGDRVWLTLAADGRPASGTAQEYTVVPAERAFRLPDYADFELGASIGIPGVTAHRALTVAEDGPARDRGEQEGQHGHPDQRPVDVRPTPGRVAVVDRDDHVAEPTRAWLSHPRARAGRAGSAGRRRTRSAPAGVGPAARPGTARAALSSRSRGG